MQDFFTQIATNPFLQGIFIFLGILIPVIIFVIPYLKRKKKDESVQEKPILQIVNFGMDFPEGSDHTKAQYHPNLRNDGKIPVSNVRIHYKVMDRVVDLMDIIRDKDEIKKREIPYEGSILPSDSARVGYIPLQKTQNEISLILWIDYDFNEKDSDEIIFNIGFKNYEKTFVIPYIHSVIVKASKEWDDFKQGKRSAPM